MFFVHLVGDDGFDMWEDITDCDTRIEADDFIKEQMKQFGREIKRIRIINGKVVHDKEFRRET
ncbi:unnamed protein product [marine sediment metagenome]|uniref:Uncharacterized protein n=1 Tax=marine sediment metagenome TaxID=412755 RepID=X0XJR6_9ZZZZ